MQLNESELMLKTKRNEKLKQNATEQIGMDADETNRKN